MYRMALNWLLIMGAVALLLVLPGGCEESAPSSGARGEAQSGSAPSSAPTDPTTNPPSTQSPEAADSAHADAPADRPALQYPPVATFDQHCARCHGPEGSFYGQAFAQTVEHDLTEMVGQMMRGPAFLEPNSTDIAAMAAYQRALAAEEPFVIVTDPQKALATDLSEIPVEASPGAQVTIERTNGTAQITASRDGRSTTIHFPDEQWSGADAPTAP